MFGWQPCHDPNQTSIRSAYKLTDFFIQYPVSSSLYACCWLWFLPPLNPFRVRVFVTPCQVRLLFMYVPVNNKGYVLWFRPYIKREGSVKQWIYKVYLVPPFVKHSLSGSCTVNNNKAIRTHLCIICLESQPTLFGLLGLWPHNLHAVCFCNCSQWQIDNWHRIKRILFHKLLSISLKGIFISHVLDVYFFWI